jgi:hypothetical protein
LVRQVDNFGITKLHKSPEPATPDSTYHDMPAWEYESLAFNIGPNEMYDLTNVPINMPFKIPWDNYLHFSSVPAGVIRNNGNGSLTIFSESLISTRLMIYDDNNLLAGTKAALDIGRGRRWSPSTEMTCYFNLKFRNPDEFLRGDISMRIGSDHHFIASGNSDNDCPYNAHEYTFHIGFNGDMWLGGEPYHGTERDPKPDGILDIANRKKWWSGTTFGEFPMNQLVGFKFIKRVCDDGNNVFLEVFRDLTEGFNGGTWQRIMEFKHERGNWDNPFLEEKFLQSIANGGEGCVIKPWKYADKPFTTTSGMHYLRIPSVRELDIQWLSARDIEPMRYPDLHYYNEAGQH